MRPKYMARPRRLATMLAVLSLLLGVATVVTAPSAAAEEDCTTNFFSRPDGSFLPCPNSRTTGSWAGYAFKDDNSDSDPTSLHLMNCSSNPDIDLLFYEPSGINQGWHKVGSTKRFWCLNSDGGWQSWGRQTRVGLYVFAVADDRGTSPLSGWLHAGW